MAADSGNPVVSTGRLAGEADDFIRSEPGFGWVFSQLLYVAQPILEAFWSGDQIRQLAEAWEHAAPEDAEDPSAHSASTVP